MPYSDPTAINYKNIIVTYMYRNIYLLNGNFLFANLILNQKEQNKTIHHLQNSNKFYR